MTKSLKLCILCTVITEDMMLYLQQHVSRLNSAIGCYGATFHDRADVYASISSVITLPHYADAQEIILFCNNEGWTVLSVSHMVTIISIKCE